jgi:thioesterase domain-containing protein
MQPPRDSIEMVVLRTFRSVLRTGSEMDIHSNFFDFGGSSLTAVMVRIRLEDALGPVADLSGIYRAPTAESLARLVRSERAGISGLIPFHDPADVADDLAPIVMLHGIGGDAIFTQGLAEAGDGRQVYGLQAESLRTGKVDALSIEQLAERYLALVRETIGPRPFVLAGYSVGAVPALEMHLHNMAGPASERSRLVLIAPPDPSIRRHWSMPMVLRWLHAMVSDTGAGNTDQPDTDADEATLRAAVRAAWVGAAWVPADIADVVVNGTAAMMLAYLNAAAAYEPAAAVADEVTLVLSREETEPFTDDRFRRAVPRWRAERVDAAHSLLLVRPWVGQTAKHLHRTAAQLDADR